MKVTAKFVGGAGVARTFARMGQAARGEVLENALLAGALVIANRWKELAPVDTGQYRRSIHVGGHADETQDFELPSTPEAAELPGPEKSDNQVTMVIGTAIRRQSDWPEDWKTYPEHLEDGTTKMAARPSAQPAFDEKKDEAVRTVERALKTLIRKAAR